LFLVLNLNLDLSTYSLIIVITMVSSLVKCRLKKSLFY